MAAGLRRLPGMSPYVSFVMFARNDGYGHRGTSRLQHSMDVLLQQLNDHALESEILLVEWNPPDDAAPLAQALRVSGQAGVASVRVITVPGRFHTCYSGHAEKGMHVAAAFNVGLRRARGTFVLPKPSDIYFSDQVLERLARRDLDSGTIYRVDRFDVDSAALVYAGMDRQRFFGECSQHVVRQHAAIDVPGHYGIRDLHTNACGDFSLMSRELWWEIRGWREGESVASLDVDSLALHGAAACGAREVRWPDPCRVYKLIHGAMTLHRVGRVFRTHERWIESIAERTLSIRARTWVRIVLDYPKRTVRDLPGRFPSFERNFLRPARRWSRGMGPCYLNPDSWGLADQALPEARLLQGNWDSAGALRS